MSRVHTLVAASILMLASTAGTAAAAQPPRSAPETVIVLGKPGPTGPASASAKAAPVAERAQRLGSTFLVPHYETTVDAPNQTSTLVAVRNEASEINLFEIEIFDEFGNTYFQDLVSLAEKETWTANFRDLLAGAPGVFTGVPTTGYATVVGTATLTVDYFQVDTANDFATGGAAFRTVDFCDDFRLRFLNGGGFDGGTIVQYYAPTPLGGNPATDPPTVTGTVYDEAGTVINTFGIYSNRRSEAFDVSGIISGSEPFGSIDWTFENPEGGIVLETHDALGRFSVRVPGFCLDSP